MTYEQLVKPAVLTQPVYEPGRPIADVAREHGLDPSEILKLASNENPLGPSPLALAAAITAIGDAHLYPDGGTFDLRAKLAARLQLDPAQILPTDGSSEAMQLLTEVFLAPGDEVVMGNYAFVLFKLLTLLANARPVEVPMPPPSYGHDLGALRAAITARTKIVYLPNPNNPTGSFNRAADVLAFARSLPPHVILCYDEAYVEFLPPGEAADLRPLIAEGRKILCCRTFSKIYGLAGLRIGYGYGPRELIALLHRARPPFNVNAVAQAAAIAALDDHAHVARTVAMNSAGLRQLAAGFDKLGLEHVPSAGNFVMFRVGDAPRVFAQLQARGVIVRPLGVHSLPEHLRVTVGDASHNARFLETLAQVLAPARR
jgi:histidinol-phosphate aminotransferase